MLVSLEVGFQIIFGKSFVNLRELSIMGRQLENDSLHLCKRIFFIGVFVSKLKRSRQV